MTGQPTRMPLGRHWDDLDFKAADMAVGEDVAHDWDSIISNKIRILQVGAHFGSIWHV